jgi:hypothetical protein
MALLAICQHTKISYYSSDEEEDGGAFCGSSRDEGGGGGGGGLMASVPKCQGLFDAFGQE